MKITKRQLEKIINEELSLLAEGNFEQAYHDMYGEEEGSDGDTHPHILSIRMVEALRPVIQSGDIEGSMTALDALWDHLHNTSPVPTNDVPEDEEDPVGDDLYGKHSEDDIEWMEDRFHQDQEDWPDEN
jgi:hypothetical protein